MVENKIMNAKMVHVRFFALILTRVRAFYNAVLLYTCSFCTELGKAFGFGNNHVLSKDCEEKSFLRSCIFNGTRHKIYQDDVSTSVF